MREALLEFSLTPLGALAIVVGTLLVFAGAVVLLAWLFHRHPGLDHGDPGS